MEVPEPLGHLFQRSDQLGPDARACSQLQLQRRNADAVDPFGELPERPVPAGSDRGQDAADRLDDGRTDVGPGAEPAPLLDGASVQDADDLETSFSAKRKGPPRRPSDLPSNVSYSRTRASEPP
jgi:hypothetical protein